MKTIKEELQECVKLSESKIKCAQFGLATFQVMSISRMRKVNLQTNYTDSELDNFWSELNIDITQIVEIQGIIWLGNGNWITRDLGTNTWQEVYTPSIPKELIRE